MKLNSILVSGVTLQLTRRLSLFAPLTGLALQRLTPQLKRYMLE